MDKKNIAFSTCSIVALFVAIQAWVWLRYIGAFWLSDSMQFMGHLVKSVSPLKISVDAFLILAFPVLLISYFVYRDLSIELRITFYTLLGALYSAVYLLIMSNLDLSFVGRQIWVYLAAGGIAGITYAAILDLLWNPTSSISTDETVSQTRRQLLRSVGVVAGTASFLGALTGPFYLWKNRNTNIDVDVSRLEDGQLMTVEVANKPIWILRRSPDVIRLLEQDNPQLLDPHSDFSQQPEETRNSLRSIRPEYLVVYGICTHLGCAPSYRPDGRADEEPRPNPEPQFFCTCHGGVFDLAGRVYKDTPPSVNMVVPAHEFVSNEIIRLHFPSIAESWNT